MPDDTTQMILIVTMLITLSAVGVFELRYLRARRRRAQGETDLPDRAHNAILTTKAIRETLSRGGVQSPEADDLVREAENAVRERNYRVAVELTDKAKGLLRSAKLKQTRKGDIAKLDSIPPKAEADEVTPKERLMKELPPNYAQSKFSINLACDEIASAKTDGRASAEAEQFLASAQASFDAQDYDAALKSAVRARRAVETSTPAAPAQETVPPAPTPSQPSVTGARPCPSCGAPLATDDLFCRRCGAKIPPPRTCPSCTAPVADEDAFCRKCGTEVP